MEGTQNDGCGVTTRAGRLRYTCVEIRRGGTEDRGVRRWTQGAYCVSETLVFLPEREVLVSPEAFLDRVDDVHAFDVAVDEREVDQAAVGALGAGAGVVATDGVEDGGLVGDHVGAELAGAQDVAVGVGIEEAGLGAEVGLAVDVGARRGRRQTARWNGG